uniref:Clathrin light chain n=1 Tax=Theileria annulata TaxID=5874 RepID=A0A3B0MTY4_THEAN
MASFDDFFGDKDPIPNKNSAKNNVKDASLTSSNSFEKNHLNASSESKQNPGESLNLSQVNQKASSTKPENESSNPYEVWQKKFTERIETLKLKEAEEIETRTKLAAAELEQWHKNRKLQIDEKLKTLLEQEPSENSSNRTEFDWITASKYLESSEFFQKDQSSGQNQKLIELIMKKKYILEKSRNSTK